jgi:alcohol-forming fatty acyl-CoA reductase
MYGWIWMQIPADMVVNAILVAMVGHAKQPSDAIYQVGSSSRNPLRYGNLQDYGYHYFTRKPWINKDGKAVKVGKVTVLDSMASFHRYMNIHYVLPLKVSSKNTHLFITTNQSNSS